MCHGPLRGLLTAVMVWGHSGFSFIDEMCVYSTECVAGPQPPGLWLDHPRHRGQDFVRLGWALLTWGDC